MRLTSAFAALGLVAGRVAGQQWQDFGAMPDLWTRHSHSAVARSPAMAKRDGVCAENNHPCTHSLHVSQRPSSIRLPVTSAQVRAIPCPC